jgi:poly-gamma-glutamate synthesis protein (capsule biosynthesis protein)
MHAGVEYDPGYTLEQQAAAHAFIDAGADVVIGTHPHVVEPLEIYNGKPIFYSLGNFLFDQDFSFATTHGLAVNLVWTNGKTSYQLIPIVIKGAEVSYPGETDRLKTLSALVSPFLSPEIAVSIMQNASLDASMIK